MTLAKAVTKTLDVDVDDVRIDLTATIKSYDLTDTKFIFDIQSSQGLTINLMGGTAMYIVEYVHNSQTYAIQGNIDIINSTKISFNLPSDLKGYKGTVLIGLYVQMADGTKIDIKDIAVRIEPSIMDKGIDFSARTYFEDFETVKAEVISKGEQAKASINAVVADVNGYGDTQKQTINNVVTDVQSTGETAKTQINQVLPSVQSQVSELNRQINALPQIPDLFVAYADDINGGGFNKTDTNKLYKGYGVKNSDNPSDYRWERNSSNLQIGGRNLFVDSGFKSDISTGSDYSFGKWYSYDGKTFNRPKYDNTCNYLYFVTSGDASAGIMQFFDTNKLVKGKTYSVRTWAKVDANTTFKYQLVKKNPDNTYNWYFKNIDVPVTTRSKWVAVTWTFDIPIDDDGIAYGVAIRNLQTGTETALRFLKPKLEIGNVFTDFSLAHEDLMLNSNPVNSILTTLSQENPSTTLGGTWVQLGTETKFDNTIYYWKRTN